MKLTLLEMVQDILNDMDSDVVNTLFGLATTIEGLQVAQILKTTYFEMMANRNWPHLRRTITLENSLETIKPTHLKLPVNIKQLEFFNYNKRMPDDLKERYSSLQFREPRDFIEETNRRNTLEDNIEQVIDFGGIKFLIRNDKQPAFYTSFDDEYLVCDSFDNTIEQTLQGSQSQCLVYEEPVWVFADEAIPDLPAEAFPALLAEAKSTAFIALKQQGNDKAEQQSRRQQRWLARKAWKVSGGVKYPDYGRLRRSRSSFRSTLLDKDGTLNVMP